jgi:hypothetical protein
MLLSPFGNLSYASILYYCHIYNITIFEPRRWQRNEGQGKKISEAIYLSFQQNNLDVLAGSVGLGPYMYTGSDTFIPI